MPDASEPHNLQGKAIVVTGSTTGIGEATARLLAARGAHVLIHGLEKDRAQTIASELPNAHWHVDDLNDPDASKRIIDVAVEAFGKLDGLVNNAAWVPRGYLSDLTPDFFDKVMNINTRAPLLLIQAAHPHLKQTQGAVVNIGSNNAWSGEPSLLAYSMSKGALMTMSKNLADAMGKDSIRINHLNLGWVLTEMEYQKKLSDGMEEGWPDRIPRQLIPIANRMTTPAEIARCIAYWISAESYPFSGVVSNLEQYPFLGRNPDKEDE